MYLSEEHCDNIISRAHRPWLLENLAKFCLVTGMGILIF